MRVFAASALLCSVVAAATAKWSAQEALKTVFGFEGNAEFDQHYSRLQNSASTISEDVKQHHLLCTSVLLREVGRLELRAAVGNENYHPVYSSTKNDVVCYSSMLTAIESARLNHFHTISTIPSFMKIHHSVMQLASNIEKSSAYYLEVHRGLGVRGKGISKVSGSSIANRVIENMKNGHNEDAHAFAAAMIHSTSEEGTWSHMWRETTSLVKSSSGRDVAQTCGFHHVTVESTAFGLRVKGLDITRAKMSCVLLLTAHLVTSSADVIMVLANKQQIPLNNFARPITQTGVSAIINNAVVAGSAPYSSAGLNGLNEVVGVGDTGLDELMCFFTEGDGTVVTRSTIEDPITNSSRRKVVQYIAFQDGGDYEEGHGTHVSGSVAGQDIDESDSQSIYNGMGTLGLSALKQSQLRRNG
jgi:hypothetical protein